MILKKCTCFILFFLTWYMPTNFCMNSESDWQTAFYFRLDNNHIIIERGYMYQGECRPYSTSIGTHIEEFLGSKAHFITIEKAILQAREENRTIERSYHYYSTFRVIPSVTGTYYEILMRG